MTAALIGAMACGGAQDEAGEANGGDPDVVQLDSAGLAAAGIELVDVRNLESTFLEATGTLTYDENAVARVGPKVEGRIVRIVHDLGDRVESGTALVILESPELGEVQAELARGQSALDLARDNYQREARLYEQKVSSQKEMLEARAAFEAAAADLEAARAKLRTLSGLPSGDGAFAVVAPIPGTVVERDVVVGQIAGPGDQLFTVAYLNQLWLVVDIYEKDLSRIARGQRAAIRTQAFPDIVFTGRVSYLGLVVDPGSHTVKARVIVDNPGGLRPGMFARAEIVLPAPAGTRAVPRQAIHELRGSQVVFVPESGGRFRAVPIQTGADVSDELVIVLSGLQVGQRVVGNGSFFLKSELLKATFGDGD